MSFDDIIAKVKAHPEIWQSSHPFYRHRVVCARTWKEIAAELKADENIIRKRWKHLKDQYRKEQKKVISRAISMSFWHHYNDLHFLSDWNVIKKRWKHLKDTFRKEIKKVNSNQVVLSTWIHYKELQFLADEVTKRHKKPESEPSETESDSEKKQLKAKRLKKRKRLETSPMPAPVDYTRIQTSLKFKRIMRSLNTMSKYVKKSTNFPDEHLKNDTDYMFLVSLLPTMNNLSDVQRLHFRGKINNWLLNALMENEFSDECENKAFVQAKINEANMQDCNIMKDCKVEMEDSK